MQGLRQFGGYVMKTFGLVTAVMLAMSVGPFGPVSAAWAQDAQTDAPATVGELPAPPAEEVVSPTDDVIEPGTELGGEPAQGEAESQFIEGTPDAESVLEGTVEPAPEAAFVMPDLPVIGVPVPGGVNYQPAATELAEDTHWLSHMVHIIMALIVALVTVLILTVIVRYNSRSNPNPARFTHNTKIEIAWTLGPVLILIVIGSFSLPILFKQLEIPEPDVTVKATGNQWFWSYEYPDYAMSFDSLLLQRDELAEAGYSEDLYLLATDTALVVPVGAVVALQVTASDVIHSWALPAFAVKMDGIPGRLNETWFEVAEPGIYFGQCSELCGKDHAYMPITVKALPQEEYDAWLDWAIDEYGGTRPEEIAAAN